MLTQCPNCHTTFRVTREILRVADGQVRCGRCQTQFDALERLMDDDGAPDVESGRFLRPSRARPAPTEIEVEEPRSHEEITLEGRRIEITGTYEAFDPDQGEIRQETREEWIEIDDVDEAVASSENLEEYSAEDAEAFDPGESFVEEDTRDLQPEAESDEADEIDLFAPQERRTTARVWKWLAAPLAALLTVQVVHHYRADLARHPRIGPPLTAAYEALGATLTPDWNLHAYEIRQWGVVSDPSAPGTLKVRASITNLATFPQPYPLLKLVLEDRWGVEVRARAFEPAEYLDPGVAPDRLLAPAQKANATIDIVDPGPDAEGFRFDVCLHGKRGVVCAEETPAPR